MAISLRTAGTWAAANATTQTVTLPTHSTGDMLIVRVGFKHATMPTTVTCGTAGWTKLGETNGTGGASSNGGGGVQVAVFYKEATSGSETNPVITFNGGSVAATPSAAVAMAYQKGGSEFWVTPVGAGTAIAAATSISETIDSHVSATAGDLIDEFHVTNDNTTLTVPSFTQTGLTLSAVTESPAAALSSATSNDISADGCYRTVSSGTSSAAAVITGTNSVADVGAGWTTRLRVTPDQTFAPAAVAIPVAIPAPTLEVVGNAFEELCKDLGATFGFSVLPGDTRVDFVGGKTITANGTVTYEVADLPADGGRKAAVFNGSTGNYLSIADHADLEFGGSGDVGTIVAVVAPTSNITGWQIIGQKGTNAYSLGIGTDGQTYTDQYTFGKAGVAVISASTADATFDGSYHMVAATKAAGTGTGKAKVYFDGSDTTVEISTTNTLATNSSALEIGRENTDMFNGAIAYWVIFQTELTAQNISDLWDALNEGGATVFTPAAVTIPVAIPAPTFSTTVSFAPAAVAVPVAIPTPTFASVYTFTPASVAVPVGIPNPTFSTTLAFAPASVTIPIAVPNPTLVVSQQLAPPPVAISVSIPTPSLALTFTMAPAPVAVPVSVPNPTLNLTFTMAPPPVAIPVGIPAPTFSTTVSFTPPAVAVPVSVPVPALGLTFTFNPAAVAVVMGIPQPTIDVAGGTQTFEPPAVTITVGTPAPTLDTSLSLAPAPVTIPISIPASTLALIYTMAPAPVTIPIGVPNPTLEYATVFAPSPVAIQVGLPTPDLYLTIAYGGDALTPFRIGWGRYPWYSRGIRPRGRPRR